MASSKEPALPKAPITMTREELYRLVWSTPVHELAKKYGLSDVGFAKCCRRVEVPRPPRGYWAKIAAGQKPRKTRLPVASDPALESFRFEPLTEAELEARQAQPAPKQPFDARIGELIARELNAPKIVVRPILSKPHALVAS